VSERWENAEGSVDATRVSGQVLLITMKGDLAAGGGYFAAKWLDRELLKPSHVFWDLFGLVTYATEVRTSCTEVLVRNRKNMLSVNAGTQSKIVRMGVVMANVALGGIMKSYADQGAFDAAVQGAAK
jgi:hypothetical protein